MPLETLLLALLVVQGLMGGFDTLVNHDLIERLTQRASARTEVGLHALREGIYAVLFAGLGWFAWHGAAAGLVAIFLIGEFLVSAMDEFVENKTRVLPQNERILHAFLTLNLGMIIGAAALVLSEWADQRTGLVLREPDLLALALSALALASVFWAVRDFRGWRRLLHRPILSRRH